MARENDTVITPMIRLMIEVKKEELRYHLFEEIPEIADNWTMQLMVPDPFTWSSVNKPTEEATDDNLHMLKRHLKSRTLWKNYTDYKLEIDRIYNLVLEVRKEAKKQYATMMEKNHTEHYLEMAIRQGFKLVSEEPQFKYDCKPSTPTDVKCGDTAIIDETDAKTAAEVIDKHKALAADLARLPEMVQLARSLKKGRQLGFETQELARKQLAERNIFHPCRFCRNLLK
jgi:hypothetical protein